MRRGGLIIGALVVLSVLATIGAQEPGADAPTPSVTNRGPRGLAVLGAWLEASGVPVVELDGALTELGEGGALVLAAPARELGADEVLTLRRFVEGGGTLVYLVSRSTPQPALHQWLQVSSGEIPPFVATPGVEDVGGATFEVTLPGGLLADAKALRLSAERTLHVANEGAVAVTAPDAVWWLREGQGEVWLAAGADLAENARLELADNARFWGQLARRGPVRFAEHHLRRADTGLPVNVVVAGLQLGFLAFLFLWSRGPRLGPPRDAPAGAHRSAREYVTAMAALTQNANVEVELGEALKRDFRRQLHEGLAIPLDWSWEQADAELARRSGVAPGALVAAVQQRGFFPLARALATVEQQLTRG